MLLEERASSGDCCLVWGRGRPASLRELHHCAILSDKSPQKPLPTTKCHHQPSPLVQMLAGWSVKASRRKRPPLRHSPVPSLLAKANTNQNLVRLGLNWRSHHCAIPLLAKATTNQNLVRLLARKCPPRPGSPLRLGQIVPWDSNHHRCAILGKDSFRPDLTAQHSDPSNSVRLSKTFSLNVGRLVRKSTKKKTDNTDTCQQVGPVNVNAIYIWVHPPNISTSHVLKGEGKLAGKV